MKVLANRPRLALLEAVVQPLVIAVGKTLLLQGPFKIPVDLGHEGKVGIFRVNRCRCFGPERFRGISPGALTDFRQHQHRHIAAYAVAFPRYFDQFLDPRRLQFGIAIIELQRIRPAGKVGVTAVSQDPRSVIGLNPYVIVRSSRQRGFIALHVKIGTGSDPGVIRCGVVRYIVQHQLDVAAGQSLAEARQRRLAAKGLADAIGRDRKSGTADIVLGEVRQKRFELRRHSGLLHDTARPAAPVCQTLSK